jgi:hypothetical protein
VPALFAGCLYPTSVGLRERVAALLGRSAYAPAPAGALSLDDPQVVGLRKAMGGQLQPLVGTATRLYLSDIESAERAADGGNLAPAARIMRAARRDAVVAGALQQRTMGLVRLPRSFRGRQEIIDELNVGHELARSVFDEMVPATELALLHADGLMLGVGVAELCPVEGRDHPVLARLDPEFLLYVWAENAWYYRSIAGLIRIVPGDGRWVLHIPGGRVAPWNHALWKPVGRSFITKDHALYYRAAWEAKLANPARVASMPSGATESQRAGFLDQLMAWGLNSVFELPPGYKAELLESNGRGYESFTATIAEQSDEIIIAINGQTPSTTGGTGFQNNDIHQFVKEDFVGWDSDALAHTVNTQILPAYVDRRGFSEEIAAEGAVVGWDATPPKDRVADSNSIIGCANAIERMTAALATAGDPRHVDVDELAARFGVPLRAAEGARANERPNLRVVRGAA